MVEILKELIIEKPIKASSGIIGYIYVFNNKVNGKIYVGKTTELYSLRWNEHKYNAFTAVKKNYFYNALRKYSWNGFDRFVIFQTEELESKEDVDRILLEKEKEFIKIFNSNDAQFGYNLTLGGDGISGYTFSEESKRKMSENRRGENHWNYGNRNGSTSKAVLQFDLDFNFVAEWPSISEAARVLSIKPNNISRCCSNKLGAYKGFIWVKKADYYTGYFDEHKKRVKCKSNDRTVYQYDVDMNYITSYISASEASRQMNCHSSTIQKAAKVGGKAKGFIWSYEKLLND